MKLLISPKSVEEAQECVKGQAEIIDVKNPVEGSLGANFPWIIRDIRKIVPTSIPISATLGDVNFKPGSVALAALGAAHAGASFVKVGLFDFKNKQQAIEVMRAVKQTMLEYELNVQVVAAGYAEGEEIGSLNPLSIPEIGKTAKCDLVMIDTYNKTSGKTIFDYLSISSLKNFISDARKNSMKVALGGSIKISHLTVLKELQPDIIGIRGAVCEFGDRIDGAIKAELIQNFIKEMGK
ncbi:MAG TPA: (5-formylfuran-3-yl)methyl phosphate synthase [candidate division Zixibacteria bacterium]|nr:(5-formylfuran-3-yl)methyl phosphate synthase [candidate division Zixibacteria bacterium]